MVALDSPEHTQTELVLTESQAGAVRGVRLVWPDAPVLLIGATALAQHIRIDRVSNDIDVAVSAPIEGFGDELAALPGWSRKRTMEHRFISPDDQMLDVLPASPALIQQGYIEWASGARMSLIGFDLAFANGTQRVIAASHGGTAPSVTLPSAPAIAFLKMRAWLDRPNERAKDLLDLALLFERYIDEERLWAGEFPELAQAMDYDEISPFVLGRDLARIVAHEHRTHVEQFLGAVQPVALSRRKSLFADDEHDERAHAAFARGFRSAQGTP